MYAHMKSSFPKGNRSIFHESWCFWLNLDILSSSISQTNKKKNSHWKVIKNAKQTLVLFQKGLGPILANIPYAYDVTEGRPAALGVKRNTATCVIAKHAARGANPASHTAGLARPGPRTESLSANAHCQHNTCALRDTRLASLLWRCDPLWRQCIRSISDQYARTTDLRTVDSLIGFLAS